MARGGGGGGGIKGDDIAALALVGGVVYLYATDQLDDLIAKAKEVLDSIGGRVAERVPTPSGGGGGTAGPTGPISTGGGCPSGTNCGPCRPQSGGIRCECNNYKGASYEATFCGTWSGDDLSIKMWGPTHSGNNCCWCILNTSPSGQMKMRGEGPHPDTSDIGPKGSVGGKPTCVKAVIRPGPRGAHVEGYGLVGGVWKKGLTYDGPCGLNKKSTTVSPNQQVSFRCDGQLSTKCATVRPLGAAPASASYTRAYLANHIPHITNDNDNEIGINTITPCKDIG